QQELQQTCRLVQFRPVVAAFRDWQVQQHDLRGAAERAVASGQFQSIGSRWHQRVRVSMKLQDRDAGLREWSGMVDRVEFGGTAFEFLQREAVAQLLDGQTRDVGQARIGAKVDRGTHSGDSLDTRWMTEGPTVGNQAAVTVG